MTKITFTISTPARCTDAQLVEWIRWRLNDTSEIRASNPLANETLEPQIASLLIEQEGVHQIYPK